MKEKIGFIVEIILSIFLIELLVILFLTPFVNEGDCKEIGFPPIISFELCYKY